MGCFDVSCGISSITIKHGEKTLLLLLIPSTSSPDLINIIRDKVEIEPCVNQVHGPNGLYIPFCLPVRGKYNDYGSLEDIVEDDTTKALKTYFGATIEQIITVIHNGEYGKIHDPEILTLYGNGLKIDKYSNGKVTPKWMLDAGFVEKDGKYFHPEVSNIIKMTDAKVVKTEEQMAYVVFKEIDKKHGSQEKDKIPHIIYWENDKWNETWPERQHDFCESFMQHTKPMGWFSSDHGVVLGLTKDGVKKASLLMKLSGMFIDGRFYEKFTEEVKTNSFYMEHANSILTSYMNRFVMDKISGFKFERIIDEETQETVQDKGVKISYRQSKYQMLYSHSKATDFLFGVRMNSGSMATDMYRVKGKKLEKVKTYDGKRSYHPFSPEGLAVMFKGETGNELDLSGLVGVKPFDITMLKIQDLIKRKRKSQEIVVEMEKKLETFKKGDDSKARKAVVEEYVSHSIASETREDDKSTLGDYNFPMFFEFYSKHFMKPNQKFTETCVRFKNFMASLWSLNRMLMPSSHFSQHGDLIDQMAFNNIIRDSLKEKILSDYGQDYVEKKQFDRILATVFGRDLKETTETNKKNKKEIVEIVFTHEDKEVARWQPDEDYGYIVTEKGH